MGYESFTQEEKPTQFFDWLLYHGYAVVFLGHQKKKGCGNVENLLCVYPEKQTKITRLATSFKDGLTLGMGKALYMVYERNQLIYESHSLFNAYMHFVSPHNEPLTMVGSLDQGYVLLVSCKKAYFKEKKVGAFTSIKDLTICLCRDIRMFIRKRDSEEAKRIEMLDYFYRGIGDTWESILPNLDMKYLELNQLYKS